MTHLTQAQDLLRADGFGALVDAMPTEHDLLVRSLFARAGVEVCQGEAYDADVMPLALVELTLDEMEALERIKQRQRVSAGLRGGSKLLATRAAESVGRGGLLTNDATGAGWGNRPAAF
jgi:hypothetical protein